MNARLSEFRSKGRERERERERERYEERRLQASRKSARRWEQSTQHLEYVRVLRDRLHTPIITYLYTHTNVCVRKSTLFRERNAETRRRRGSVRKEREGNPGRRGNERIRGIRAPTENNEKERERERERKREKERDVHVCVTRSYISTPPLPPPIPHTGRLKRTRVTGLHTSRTKRAAYMDLYERLHAR